MPSGGCGAQDPHPAPEIIMIMTLMEAHCTSLSLSLSLFSLYSVDSFCFSESSFVFSYDAFSLYVVFHLLSMLSVHSKSKYTII